MWISEPPDCYDARQARLHSPARLCWDHDILNFLRRHHGQPLHFMRAVNSVARTREHGCNRRKVAAKREIILALGRLVRVGRVTDCCQSRKRRGEDLPVAPQEEGDHLLQL